MYNYYYPILYSHLLPHSLYHSLISNHSLTSSPISQNILYHPPLSHYSLNILFSYFLSLISNHSHHLYLYHIFIIFYNISHILLLSLSSYILLFIYSSSIHLSSILYYIYNHSHSTL